MVETNTPKISIVTVTFNAQDFLEKTIRSVSEQTHSNFEYLLIDGGSTDGTMEIARRNEASLTKIVSEPDDGIYSAMNKGVRLSQGEWVFFLNAGDEFHEETTLEQINDALTVDVDFVYGDRCRLSIDGGLTRENAGKIQNTYYKEVVFHQALFTRTALLKKRPYNECYRSAADYEYVVHGYKTGKKFKYKPLIIANFLEGGVSNKNYLVTNIEATKASLDHIPSDLSIKKNYYFENIVVGSGGYYLNQRLQASKGRNPHLRVRAEPIGRSLRLFAEGGTTELDRFLDGMNRALKETNIVDEDYIDSAVSRPQTTDEAGSDVHVMVGGADVMPRTLRNEPIKITVVTVSFNSADQIKTTIDNVLDQNYPDIEYIVVDGDSSDGTSEILEEYKEKISQILVEKDNGIYHAMNKGIDLATGDYILFMNAGDSFCDRNVVGRIFSGEQLLEDLVYGDRIYVKTDGEQVYQEAKDLDTAYVRIPYCHQSLFIRTEVIRKFRFNTSYKYAADYEQSLRLLKAGCSYKRIESPICKFLQGGKSESGARPYIEAIKIILDNCNDKATIRKNHYFSVFKNNAGTILDV